MTELTPLLINNGAGVFGMFLLYKLSYGAIAENTKATQKLYTFLQKKLGGE